MDDRPFIDGLELQSEDVKMEFESRSKAILLSLAEQGLNAALYWTLKTAADFKDYTSIVPTSAHTGEGVPDILMLLVQLSQKMLVDRVM